MHLRPFIGSVAPGIEPHFGRAAAGIGRGPSMDDPWARPEAWTTLLLLMVFLYQWGALKYRNRIVRTKAIQVLHA